MKVAVTGATGFIGRHVVSALLARGHHVVAITRRSSTSGSLSDAAALEELVVPIETLGPDGFDQIGRPDALVHLAWGCLDNFNAVDHVERELPLHLTFLRMLIEGGLNRIIGVGTCLEYGLQHGPLREDLPTDPVTPYGLAKDTLRKQLEMLRRDARFSFAWGRVFYMHGGNPLRRTLFVQLREAALRGDASFSMSGGEQLRDYLAVEQVGAALAALVDVEDPGIVNICSGKPISIRRLVEGWIAENGWSIELALGHYPYLSYEPLAFWGDPAKASEIFGR